MSRFMNELQNKESLIKLQWVFIGILTVTLMMSLRALQTAPKDMTFHVPPDLRAGAQLKAGEVPPPNVYAFAYYIWQQVNRWPTDGEKDYGAAIFRMQGFVTPSCRQQLEEDLKTKGNNGELTLRTRSVQEVAGNGYEEARVVPAGNEAWKVLIDYEIIETVRGMAVKNTNVRYPLRVVRFDADRERNPFGLAIDCYYGNEQPTRIDLVAERRAANAASAPSKS